MNNSLKIAEASQVKSVDNNALTAREEAKKIENTAFQFSTSREEYDQSCQDTISSYQKLTSEAKDFPISPEPTPKPTTTVGPYTNCTRHYTGLFSTIYRCPSTSSPPNLLAIKVTFPASEQPPHDSKREARILSTISHPNIVSLLSTRTLKPRNDFLLIFPFMPLTLANCLQTSSPIPKSVLRGFLGAVKYLHGKGILHRDIKPTNILLSSPIGPAFLADFGIAWSPNDPASEPVVEKITDIGTTCYRAPELLFGCRNYGIGIDLWAAGCVAAEIFYHNAHCRAKKTRDWTLFDAGELGSELALVKSIFETLGTPNEETWPESRQLPDWGKMSFVTFPAKPWEEILPGVSEVERDLIGRLVRYESGERICAAEVLNHAYFEGLME
ncbi:MAG: hypothetical protein Q9217_005886 [Psora testacea]